MQSDIWNQQSVPEEFPEVTEYRQFHCTVQGDALMEELLY